MPTVFNNPAKSNAIVDAHGNNITLQRSNGKRVTLKELKDGTVWVLVSEGGGGEGRDYSVTVVRGSSAIPVTSAYESVN